MRFLVLTLMMSFLSHSAFGSNEPGAKGQKLEIEGAAEDGRAPVYGAGINLILNAAKDFKIDLKKSWMIGDSKKDIEAAHTAGCNHILLKNNQKLLDLIKELINSSTLTRTGIVEK